MLSWMRRLWMGLMRRDGVQSPPPVARLHPGDQVRDEYQAMQLSAVWAGVHLLAETVGSLRPLLQRRVDGGWVEVDDHPMADVLGEALSSRELVEHITAHLVLHGNAFLVPIRGGRRVREVQLLLPAHVAVDRQSGQVVYRYRDGASEYLYSASEVVHLRRLGDGVTGMSALEYGALSLGVAKGAERAVAAIYRNGGKRSGVLMTDRVLTERLRAELRDSFRSLTEGQDDRLLVLEGGLRFEPLAMSPQDIELLASRQYQVTEVCRWLGVPPELLFVETETPAAAHREVWRHWVQTTVLGYVQRIEGGLTRCMAEADRKEYRVRLSMVGLLRADDRERMEAWRIAIHSGVLTPNEARAREGLPPMEGGDRLLIQGATVPLTEQEPRSSE